MEMDEQAMISMLPHDLPDRNAMIMLIAHAAGGLLLGALYFHGVWWNVRLLTGGRHRMLAALAGALRFAILAALLTLVSHEGAAPLLTTAGAILVARALVMRRLRAATP